MSSDRAKEAAGRAACRLVRDGMRIGLGTGSTAHWFIVAVGEAVRGGLRVQAVASSEASAALAAEVGIELVELDRRGLDLAVDGADLVDPQPPAGQGRWGSPRAGEGGGPGRPPVRGRRRPRQAGPRAPRAGTGRDPALRGGRHPGRAGGLRRPLQPPAGHRRPAPREQLREPSGGRALRRDRRPRGPGSARSTRCPDWSATASSWAWPVWSWWATTPVGFGRWRPPEPTTKSGPGADGAAGQRVSLTPRRPQVRALLRPPHREGCPDLTLRRDLPETADQSRAGARSPRSGHPATNP